MVYFSYVWNTINVYIIEIVLKSHLGRTIFLDLVISMNKQERTKEKKKIQESYRTSGTLTHFCKYVFEDLKHFQQ